MPDISAFLTIDEFQAMFPRTLSTAERALATKLLLAAAIWIRDPSRRPDIAPDDVNAQLVSFDVTSEVLLPGEHKGQTSYSKQAGDRIVAFSLAQAAAMLHFTDLHRQMLGMSMVSTPRAVFDADPAPMPVWNPAWWQGWGPWA